MAGEAFSFSDGKKMKYASSVLMIFAAVGISACAANAPPNPSNATLQAVGEPPQPKWTGTIRATIIDKLDEADTTSTQRNYGSHGSLTWTHGATPALSNATIDFTYSATDRELTWGIFFGPCGSATLPVVSLSVFPELEMSSGGHTQVVAALSTELPVSGAFHVEVFRDRSGAPEFSVACGNLKFSHG
ncbi:MAG: hypothetical protein ACRD3J_20540 [Thermoanaerobaculia bacterium]